MRMFSNEVRRWERRLPGDLDQIRGMLANYRDPDPALGGTPEALPLLAQLMAPDVQVFIDEYDGLLGTKGVPTDLRRRSLELLQAARELADVLAMLMRSSAELTP